MPNFTTSTLMATQNADQVAITGGTISGTTSASTVRSTSALTKNGSAAYSDVPGLSMTLAAGGIYRISLVLQSTVASGTGGIKYAFNYTNGLTLTSLNTTAQGFTASAVAVQNASSTTAQADLFTQAAVVISVAIEGIIVVNAGGTITVQMAQNTSNGSDTITLANSTLQIARIAA